MFTFYSKNRHINIMPKSRHRKQHKQKSAARTARLQQEKAKQKKIQSEYINALVQQYQEQLKAEQDKIVENTEINESEQTENTDQQ